MLSKFDKPYYDAIIRKNQHVLDKEYNRRQVLIHAPCNRFHIGVKEIKLQKYTSPGLGVNVNHHINVVAIYFYTENPRNPLERRKKGIINVPIQKW